MGTGSSGSTLPYNSLLFCLVEKLCGSVCVCVFRVKQEMYLNLNVLDI